MNDINDIERIFIMAEELADVKKKALDKLPFHINVIESAARGKLRETAHSMILADLLRHPQIQASFLEWAFNLDVAEGILEVETEYGSADSHIDIALYDKEHFIIIENKANWAQEQHSQIYRYVEEIAHMGKKYAYEQIYVLYLNPLNHDEPSGYSVTQNGCDVRQVLKERFKIWSFANDIVEWLKSLDSVKEPFVQSAIHQYIDYIQHFYHTSNDYKEMKQAMEQYLNEKLGFSEEALNLDVFEKESNKIRELLATIETLWNKRRKQWLIALTKSLAKKYGEQQIDYFCGEDKSREETKGSDHNWPKAGVKVTTQQFGIINVMVEYNIKNHDLPSYGIRMSKQYERRNRLIEELKKTHAIPFKDIHEDSDWWPMSCHTSYNKIEERVSQLIKVLKEKL